MRRLARVVVLSLVVLGFAPTARATDFALLVGAGDYSSGKSGLRNLDYPKNDVVDFATALVECGYRRRNVVLMFDGNGDNSLVPESAKIRNQFDLLLKDLTPADSVIVALAGHGVQFIGDKANYYCPLDAELEGHKNLISLTEVYDRLHECQAARKMLLVDACRDDPVSLASRSGFPKEKLESVTRPQVEGVPDQTIAIFSCQAGQKSWEDKGVRHGIFFYHVIKGLGGAADAPNPDGRITVRELTDYVTEETQAYARLKLKRNQTPRVRDEGDSKWVLRTLRDRATPAASPLAQANRLRIAGDHRAAREAYDRAILAEPNDAKAYLGRGLVELAMNEAPAALRDFREAVRLDKTNIDAWTSLGGTQGRSGKFTDAVESYSRALALSPDAVAPLAGRGAAQIKLGKIEAGLKDLNRALAIDPRHVDALYNRALAHRKRGDIASAKKDLDRAKAVEGAGR
jgi:tetratricopeptide (TPR) repeat protein